MAGEIVLKSVLLFGSAGLYWRSTGFRQLAPYQGIGPEFWPQLLLLGIMAITGVSLVRDVAAHLKRGGKTVERNGAAPGSRSILLLSMVVALAYVFGMRWTGFLAGTLLFQVAFMYVLRVRSVRSIALVALVNTGLLFGIFIKLLNMPLPRGLGVFRDLSLWLY